MQRRLVVYDLHCTAAEYIRWAHQHGVSDSRCGFDRPIHTRSSTVVGLTNAELARDRVETLTILCDIDRVRRCAKNRNASCFESARQLERRLAAQLHYHSDRLFTIDDLQDVFERQWLKIQLVGDVEVGRHRFRIRVDHYRLESLIAES